MKKTDLDIYWVVANRAIIYEGMPNNMRFTIGWFNYYLGEVAGTVKVSGVTTELLARIPFIEKIAGWVNWRIKDEFTSRATDLQR